MKQKEITQIVDTKEKSVWAERIAFHYLEFIDYQILWDPIKQLIWIYDIENNEWVSRTVDNRNKSLISFYNELYHFIGLHGLYENRFTNKSRLMQEVEKIIAILLSHGKKYITPWFPDDRYFNLQDGVFDTKEIKLIPHKEAMGVEFWTDEKFNFNGEGIENIDLEKWNVDKGESPMLYKFLKGALEDDTELNIMMSQLLAVLVAPIRYPVAYIVTGVQNTAKSTTLDIASLLVPSKTGRTKMENFAGKDASRFSLASAVLGKKLNISEEIPEERIYSSVLKDIITAKEVEIEKKGIDASIIKVNTRFMGTTNNVLQFDSLEGLERRLIYLPLNRQIPAKEIDIELVDKIRDNPNEMRSLFILALKGLLLIETNKHMENLNWMKGFYISNDSLEAKEEVREVSRPTFAFFNQIQVEYTGNNNDAIVTKSFHEAYSLWAEDNGHKGSANMSSREFNSQFVEYIRYKFAMSMKEAKGVKKQKRINSVDRAIVFEGFTIKDLESLKPYSNFDTIVLPEEDNQF